MEVIKKDLQKRGWEDPKTRIDTCACGSGSNEKYF
jgi:hypothetical protein